MYFDSHAHLTSPELSNQLDRLMARAREAGVKRIVNICTDTESLEKGLAAAEIYPEIWNAAATTPHDVEKEGERFFPLVKAAAKSGKLSAIGETGLDHYYAHSPIGLQKTFLLRYLELASASKLPLIVHCREAFADLFNLVDTSNALIHCFTGNLHEAKRALDRGWLLSFSGIITFKKSNALRDVVRFVPLDKMLIETDAPYLAPQSRRGNQNEPAFVVETAAMIAEIKGISVEEVARVTFQNGVAFFGQQRV